MNNPRPRLSPASLVAALALVIICTQAAAAQEAPRPAAPAPAAAETAAKSETANAKSEATDANAKSETANTAAKSEAAAAPAKETAPAAKDAAKDAAAAEVPAKPAAAEAATKPAPEKCECESPDEPDAAAPSASPVDATGAPVAQLFASAAVPPANDAPELFPRLSLRDDQQTDPQHQQSGSNSTQLTPLTYKQKMSRAFRNAFFNPLGIGRTLVSSAITQYNEDDQPHKTREDEFADFGTRFAINFSRRATRTLLGSGVYPVIFNQDPRYDRAEEGKGLVARAGHAVSRVFVQRGDGGELQPAVSRWAGSLSASALSNLWERSTPGHDRIGTDATFKRFANSFVSDAINFLFVEFWPDISKIFKR